ncbi:MAG: hypothetical protein RMJ44_03850 [Cytophagales bacterium]|nr:hypothetical protein [Bernardetiaceae bacterium]MDW8210196.1 hypothetical protein [Cytophagales bacterium]
MQCYRTVPLAEAVALSADAYGNLYVGDKQGNIHAYDSLGNYRLTYSPTEVAQVSLLDARATVRIFAFYRELQRFDLLNRFLTPIETYRFQLPEIGFVRMATLAADNSLWIYDDSNFSLKKFDKKFNYVLLQTDLSLIFSGAYLDIVQMLEYQNQLFLLASNFGILRFDNIGNFINRIPTHTPCFALGGDAIFFYDAGNVIKQNLYTGERALLSFSTPLTELRGLTIVGNSIVTLEENSLRFWR